MITQLPLLSILIWLPIIAGGFQLMVMKNSSKEIIENVSLIIAVVVSLVCLFVMSIFNNATLGMQFVENHTWFPEMGIAYSLGVDGFSMPLIALTCFMTVIVVIAGRSSKIKDISRYYAAFFIMQGFVCGMFAATDAILFYMFFEALLIPMFLIIGIWGGNNRVYATLKFFLYTFLGSIFLLVALIYLYIVAQEQYSSNASFAISIFQSLELTLQQQKWLFWAFLIAFAVKIPMWPVHTWLPDAHVEAPTGGSVILAAITLKVGGYGLIRFLLPIVPDASVAFSWIVIWLSLIAIAYVGFVALVQRDLKKLIAYSSISHMGFVTLGLFLVFTGTSSIGDQQNAVMGIEGSMIQMISHGFISGALFLCVGVLYERLQTRLINDYGGVANSMPIFASFFMLFALANVGLPGTSGFVGEFLVILAAFKVNFWYAFIAATTLILGASYTLWMYKRVMFGSITNNTIALFADLNINEKVIFMLLAAMVILFGLWPAPLLDMMHVSVENLVHQIVQSKI